MKQIRHLELFTLRLEEIALIPKREHLGYTRLLKVWATAWCPQCHLSALEKCKLSGQIQIYWMRQTLGMGPGNWVNKLRRGFLRPSNATSIGLGHSCWENSSGEIERNKKWGRILDFTSLELLTHTGKLIWHWTLLSFDFNWQGRLRTFISPNEFYSKRRFLFKFGTALVCRTLYWNVFILSLNLSTKSLNTGQHSCLYNLRCEVEEGMT